MADQSSGARGLEGLRALSLGERVTGAGCLIVIIAAFLSWSSFGPLISVNGLHSWGVLTWLIGLATAALVAVRSPLLREAVRLPPLPVPDAAIFLGAGVVEIITVVLYANHFSGLNRDFGFYLVIVGAVLTALGGPLAERYLASTAAARRSPAPSATPPASASAPPAPASAPPAPVPAAPAAPAGAAPAASATAAPTAAPPLGVPRRGASDDTTEEVFEAEPDGADSDPDSTRFM